jgi:hypothetical protein
MVGKITTKKLVFLFDGLLKIEEYLGAAAGCRGKDE